MIVVIVIIVLLLIVSIGVGGYIYYTRSISRDSVIFYSEYDLKGKSSLRELPDGSKINDSYLHHFDFTVKSIKIQSKRKLEIEFYDVLSNPSILTLTSSSNVEKPTSDVRITIKS